MGKQSLRFDNPQLISYKTLRKAIGILGISFPFILVIGSIISGKYYEIQPSISDYYHTNMENFFVGLLCAIALFLYAYNGYEKRDSIAGNLGCIFALGVAFFPTSISCGLSTTMEQSNPPIIGTIHLISAAALFLVLSYFSLVLFTKTKDSEKPTKKKLYRNRIYKICGIIMLGCICLIAIYLFCNNSNKCVVLSEYHPVFWLESIALWAFGVSWLTKGEAILNDSIEYA